MSVTAPRPSAMPPAAVPAAPAAPAPRLTRLELTGFKSFATRTLFAFEPGITAIVGPNGSGKSNVADAVRWVLGEQGQSALRARRTEDVIFAGGQGRAPAGLAEATLTFDNAGRWLPIDFAEVSVTRRAFRSGENHYLINGKRVRLKDVAQLTASLGQSHVVVGQGLVDAALSQRADERRSLFEHAADLAGLRLKLAEAERSLAETEANTERLGDLLTELEPRLRSLARAARQAREWQSVRDRLQRLQQTHFGRKLTAAAARAEAAGHQLAQRRGALDHARNELDKLANDAASLSGDAGRARAALAGHDAARATVNERLRSMEHERDLAAERAAALARRGDDMADTREGLEARAGVVAGELARLTPELAAIARAVAEAEAAVREREREVQARQASRQALGLDLERLGRARAEMERERANCGREEALLEQRAESIGGEHERILAEAAGRRERRDRLVAESDEVQTAEQAAAETRRRLDERITTLTGQGERAGQRLDLATAALAERDRQVADASTRLNALTRMQQSGAGLHAGVREVLMGAASGGLTGVVGTVAELIEVPPELDTAVEVALGSHLQDIVVERWADAETAIAHLKRSRAGRATFQPLDTVRGGTRDARVEPALRLPGTRGVAADLVRVEAKLSNIVGALLGRTLVVTDLPAARQSLAHLSGGWSAVTLGGEIARAGGSVTGGVAARESGLLARERDLRGLPDQIRRLSSIREREEAARAAAASEAATVDRERRESLTERAALAAAGQERARQRQRLDVWIAELQRDLDESDARLTTLRAEETTIAATRQHAADRAAAIQADLTALGEQVAELTARQQQAAAAMTGGERDVADLNQRRAGLLERQRAEQRRLTDLRGQERALDDELRLRSERAALLENERSQHEQTHHRLVATTEEMRAERDALADARFPLHASARRLEAAAAQADRAVVAAREALLARDHEHGASELGYERAGDEVAAIRRQIERELELAEPEGLLSSEVEDDGHGDDDQTREQEIDRLRDRLRRVGYVGQDVVAEHEREAAHLEFVQRQLADVHGAAASLRGMLTDVRGTMRSRFDATFARVAVEFAALFAVLFTGGTAQLILTGGEVNENGSKSEAGVDIIAQPPGKRPQSLALLSGGERALTAVALLFAILRVNPAPFCLLDEVDAALDEANVVRFRDQLGDLAARTQVIIVTHNRGTIETADTLYGVSMGDDGVSRVLSLRMSDQPPTPEG